MRETPDEGPRRQVGLMCAPNGGRFLPADHPAIPITALALAETAEACVAAGAGAIHFHVRDDQGRHCLDPVRYRDATAAMRDRVGPDVHLQITTEAQGHFTPQQQAALIHDLVPDGVSIALREILPEDQTDAGWDHHVTSLFDWMAKEGIAYQLILYRPGELDRLARLRENGVLPSEPASLLFVLGSYAPPVAAESIGLLAFLAKVNPIDRWWIAAFGPEEGRCTLTAALLGGHIRLGFENNFNLLSGARAPDNASLVAETTALLASMGFQVSDPKTTRRLLEKPGK